MNEPFFTLSSNEIILSLITGGLFFIQLLYHIIVYARPLKEAQKRKNDKPTFTHKEYKAVSIVVYANGDIDNLQKNLPLLLNQNYPQFEVIVVNDGFDDECENILKRYSIENKHLYYTFVPNKTQYLSHKKLALTMGIKAAKYEIILFTEISSYPLSDQWISSIISTYNSRTEIVLGFSSYPYNSNFFHKLVAYDNLKTGLQMIASALVHYPYIGNGNNLSYNKAIFFANKGYSHSLNLHAGADDLFINQVATQTNTEVQYIPESIVCLNKINRYNEWRDLKMSRATTQQYYKKGSLYFYRIEYLSFILFLCSCCITVSIGTMGNWSISIFAGLLLLLRYIVKGFIFQKSALLLQQKPSTLWFPILEICLLFYKGYIGIYRLFKGKKNFTSKI